MCLELDPGRLFERVQALLPDVPLVAMGRTGINRPIKREPQQSMNARRAEALPLAPRMSVKEEAVETVGPLKKKCNPHNQVGMCFVAALLTHPYVDHAL